MNSRKYMLGVSHMAGEEELALEILRQNSMPEDLVGVEVQPKLLQIFNATLSETLQNPSQLREILNRCNTPNSYYWANLMRLSILDGLRLRFLALDSEELIR
ncbi:MAG: hypothetical protein WC796_04320 [Candidatus Pacearchaeota archaeon]|jgi:hypothetical protein